MKFLNKRKTTERTAPLSVPIVYPQGVSPRERALIVDQIVRSAATTLDTSKLKSWQRQNRSLRAIGAAMPSTVTLERTGPRSWLVTLGTHSSTGIYLDWSVQVVCTTLGEGDFIALTTPSGVMENGILVNGDAHDILRELIVEGAAGKELRDDGLVSVSEKGLGRLKYDAIKAFVESTPEPWSQRFRIRTRMTAAEVSSHLRLVQERCTQATDTAWCFEVGMAGYRGGTVTVRRDNSDPEFLVGHVDFAPTGHPIPDRVALRKTQAFLALALDALHVKDGDGELLMDPVGDAK